MASHRREIEIGAYLATTKYNRYVTTNTAQKNMGKRFPNYL